MNDFKTGRLAQAECVAETLVASLSIAVVKTFTNLSHSCFSTDLQAVLRSVLIFVVQLVVGEVRPAIILSRGRLMRSEIWLLAVWLEAIIVTDVEA